MDFLLTNNLIDLLKNMPVKTYKIVSGDVVLLRQPTGYRIPFECWRKEEKPDIIVELASDGSIHVYQKTPVIVDPIKQYPLSVMIPENYWEKYSEVPYKIESK